MNIINLTNGQVDIILFFDMTQFVAPENRNLFEELRCTTDLRNALFEKFLETNTDRQGAFTKIYDGKNVVKDLKSGLDAAGISNLGNYAAPSYQYDPSFEIIFAELSGASHK